jgi:CBS domain-containing protein
MPTVADILARKGNALISLPPSATVFAAAELLNAYGIGGLPVLEAGQLMGIFTERDLLRRVVAQRRDPETTTLAEVMTAPVLTCAPGTAVEECAALMTSRRVRHLPVLAEAGLAGMITIGDVLALQVAEQQATLQHMSSYIYDNR